MSQENVDLIRRMLEEARHDPAALVAILDPDVHWEVGAISIPGADAVYHGPEGILAFFRRWVGAFDEWGYEAREIIDAGDSVVVELHEWGRGKSSGARVDQHFWQTWTLRDGKAIRGTNHTTREEALAAAGGT